MAGLPRIGQTDKTPLIVKNVGNHENFGMARQQVRLQDLDLQRTEKPGKADLLPRLQLLVTEYHHGMTVVGRPDLPHHIRINLRRQIDPPDLRAYRCIERDYIQFFADHSTHRLVSMSVSRMEHLPGTDHKKPAIIL
jgi:hypothetical protein